MKLFIFHILQINCNKNLKAQSLFKVIITQIFYLIFNINHLKLNIFPCYKYFYKLNYNCKLHNCQRKEL